MRKQLNIGLFGFGCVGYGLYEVLLKTPSLKGNIKKICVKTRNKTRPISSNLFTYDKDDILNDETINVVVELIDDPDAAFQIVSQAMKNGKAVVTANKKMIAEHMQELLALQELYKVPLLYEASCCASIPIIRNLEEYYDNDLLESIEGVVNGSTNYILTKTAQDNLSYEDALHQAQEKGFAESNPSLDTGGFDAKYKLLILLTHAFGLVVKPNEILNLGIEGLGPLELRFAKEKGFKIKLIAQAYKMENEQIAAYVLPKFIPISDKLFQVEDEYNGIITKTAFAETQFFMGKGAGAYPTASAVLSDISALAYDYKYEYKKLNQHNQSKLASEIILKLFTRYDKSNQINMEDYFESISEQYINSHQSYVIGFITLENIAKMNIEQDVFSLLME
ncbi:MAG TPA: homoserine dehydrogenase [Saprospiraceae bacterium]|nr:homoserine dehydrogenase [Saprospiraceae bacterium]